MSRAAVLIGVNRTGKLPVLSDAVDGARRMEQWALSQGMARHRVLLFIDEAGPVDVADIRRAIRELVNSGTISQLIVYFAGHGVNIRYGEYWLLSDAPEDPSAAVNVEGSIVLARRCGIPHVVFVSDACRTAAEGVQAQGMSGSEIFPNDPVAGPENPVDIFFGTTLGRPALEVKDPAESTSAFKAVYTGALLDAISGKLPAVLTPGTVGGRQTHVVRPRPLKACLHSELPQRLAGLGLTAEVNQIPDARITSDDDAWLASHDRIAGAGPARRGSLPATRSGANAPIMRESLVQARLLALLQTAPGPAPGVRRGGAGKAPQGPDGSATATELSPAAPATGSSGCGFKVAGSTIVDCAAVGPGSAVMGGDPSSVRVESPEAAASVLLCFADGSGALLPALRGHDAFVTVDDGEIVDVSYMPSGDTARSRAFTAHASRLRELRTLVAAATRDNALRLDNATAEALSGGMQFDGHLDPSLAIYAVHAFHDLGMRDRILQVSRDLQADLGISFFDVELLSRPTAPDAFHAAAGQVPPVPLLARGWTLLSAYAAPVPGDLAGFERHLRPSLWTHFDRAGTGRLRDLVRTGRLK